MAAMERIDGAPEREPVKIRCPECAQLMRFLEGRAAAPTYECDEHGRYWEDVTGTLRRDRRRNFLHPLQSRGTRFDDEPPHQ